MSVWGSSLVCVSLSVIDVCVCVSPLYLGKACHQGGSISSLELLELTTICQTTQDLQQEQPQQHP